MEYVRSQSFLLEFKCKLFVNTTQLWNDLVLTLFAKVWFVELIPDSLDSFILNTIHCSWSRFLIVLFCLFYSWYEHPLSWHPQVCRRIHSWFSIHWYLKILFFSCKLSWINQNVDHWTMQFASFHWLSHHGLWVIILCSTK